MSQPVAAPAIIEAQGVGRRFGARKAVDGVDLTVFQGEVFGFLGPNGAGKSTLMRMLVGMLSPTTGSLQVLGLSMPRDAEALRERIGYMPQRFSLYEELSVEENLEFAAEIFGLDRAERARRIGEVMAEQGLEERRHQRAGELSGGWKQRLALATATVHRPELLVLDEPTAGVDPEQRRLLWERLFDLAGAGATILVSTHFMDEAVRCHRLCMLRRGRVVALDHPAALVAALAGRVLQIAAEPTEAAVRLLRARPEVASVTQLGDSVHVLLAAGGEAAEAAPALLAHLEAAGLGGVSGAPAPPTLEDAFVAAGFATPAEEVAPKRSSRTGVFRMIRAEG